MSERWRNAILSFCLLGCGMAARAQTTGPPIDYTTYLGAQISHFTDPDVAHGIAADAAGNAYITGDAPSGQLPVTTGPAASTGNTGFVAKLSPDGARLLYAAYLNLPAGQAIAVDVQGSAYVAGSSANTNYVVKLTPDGSALAYSYLFPPSSPSGTSVFSHLVLDSAHNVYVSGITSDTAFPTTPGSYQSTFPGQAGTPYGFLMKLDASGRVVYSTYTRVPFPAHAEPSQSLAVDGAQDVLILTAKFLTQVTLLKLDPSGSVALSTTSFPNAATPITPWTMGTDPVGNVFITGFVLGSPGVNAGLLNVVAELDANGAVLKQRNLPYFSGQVFVDHSGNVLVVGAGPGGIAYVTRVDSSFSSDTTYFLGSESDAAGGNPLTVGAAALDAAGDVYLTLSNSMNRLSQIPATPGAYQTSGGAFAVVKMDAAGLAANAPPVLGGSAGRAIAPGEIVALYGFNLGPVQLVTAGPDSQGNFPTTLAGTRLLIGGQAVPLLYSSTGQIGGVSPMALKGDANGLTTIQVEYQGVDSAVVSAPVVTTSPEILAAVINQDGSINSPANPAAPGSVVSLYGSGFGVTLPPGPDGAIATSIAWLATPVAITVGNQIATVPYAGAAPGLLNGVVQINVMIPSGIGGNAVEIEVYSGPGPPGANAMVAVR